MTRLLAAALALLPLSVAAQSVEPCDWRSGADAIPEPWDENTRSFANGEVRLALIDTIEPAATPYYLMILHPPRDEMGARKCSLIGFAEGHGYQVLYFDQLEAGYDPASGLTFTLPGRLYDPEFSFSNGLTLSVTVNQSTGIITASHELGIE